MSSVETKASWAGNVVEGRFPLQRWLGGSAHSAVFLTERQSQKAAIKLIPANGDDAEHYLSRWRAAAQLSHPHLLRIFDSGRCKIEGTPLVYVVMEYAEEDLAQIFPQRVLTPAEVSELLPPLLDALTYLRGKSFVHSRIKPSNVLAVADELKLSTDQILSAAETNSVRRRDVYDAPETAAGIFSPAGDVWSVGVTLVAMLTQNESFADENSQRDPDLPGSIPEPFRGIARECLHLDPRRRCSLAEIKARLQPPGRSVPAPPPVVAAPKKSASPHGTTWGIVIASAVLLVLFFGVRWLRRPASPTAAAPPADVKFEVVEPQKAPNPPPAIHKPAASTPAPAASTPAPAASTRALAASTPAPVPAAKTAPQGEVAHKVLPEVPQSARNTITGKIRVSVRVEVDSSGKVTSAKLASAGPSKYFANLASKAAQRWEFVPPNVNGQASPSTWMLRFRFGRAGTEATPERVSR
jgi:TonB family protein